MIARLAVLLSMACLLAAAEPPPEGDAPDDGRIHFPALQTTIVDPQADQGPLHRCSVLGGKRLCDDALGDAWCRANGFGGGFVEWRATQPVDKAKCEPDARSCSQIRAITCRGVPIVGD